MNSTDNFNQLLVASRSGDQAAWSKLVLLVYADLRRLAKRKRSEGPIPTTLGTTGLVHECYLRFAGPARDNVGDRNHFFALASRIMRQVLCDYARKRLRLKRGEGHEHEDLEEIDVVEQGELDNLVALDDLLCQLDEQHPEWARVFECRFFAGLTDEETADALNIALRTSQRSWHDARDWFATRMR